MIPAVRQVLKAESARNPVEFGGIERSSSIAVSNTADVTGDGVPEALVYLGTGGASTGEMTVMRIEDHRPVLAEFKRKNGKVSPAVFLKGASVTHSNAVFLLPKQHAVYSEASNYRPKATGDGIRVHDRGWGCVYLEPTRQDV